MNNSNRPKKFLYIGIILISLSILTTIRIFTTWDTSVMDIEVATAFYLVILLVFVVPMLAVGIILLRKYYRTPKLQEKFESSKPQQPPKQQQDAGKTQFWVCPVCGNDTKEYHGRSYCSHCERYF